MDKATMMRALQKLSNGRPECTEMILARLRGETFQEIGNSLGVSRQAVHKNLKAWIGGTNPAAWQVLRQRWSIRGEA
jgi:hypothetical protein